MEVPFWALVPFIIQLVFIAIAPLFMEHWWEQNRNKLIVSILLGVPVVLFLLFNNNINALEHQLVYDYIPFIVLLGSLFVITGGIHIGGDIQATPINNTIFLGVGYILASIVGTTGAAMLLIRPIIRTNQQRQYKTHTILFFIATVANCGGLLTPLGDPPLFLLYLRGAHFTWFLHLFPEWIITGVLLLTAYYLSDKLYFFRKENWVKISADIREQTPIRTTGNINFLLLLGVLLSVAFINPHHIESMGKENSPVYIKLLREIVLLILVFLSLILTNRHIRARNKFSWSPILEVVCLFLGIFTTMTPALLFLKEHATSLGLHAPWHFFYATGALSAFLDNAPTALAFHSVAQGLPIVGTEVAGISEILLKAISTSAVFFGAMTYIGNGPNFMIKAIAEENKVPMPSFFGYMIKFSLIILLPIYMLVDLICL